MATSTFESAASAFVYYYTKALQKPISENGTKILYNESFTILHPYILENYPKWRKFNLGYAVQEWIWYLSGDRNIKTISKYAKLWKEIADDKGNVWSNYGYHWKQNNQLEKIIALLKEDTDTRRAVVLHYDYNQLDNYTKDTPCNVALHFQIINNKLTLTVFARSIDIVYGFCNDIYIFTRLLHYVSDKLGIEHSYIHYFISNFHLYQKHFKIHLR